jgi:glycerate kinase
LAHIDLTEVAPILSEVRLTVASDVQNPLLGKRGAAQTYGPQKGASAHQVATLDRNLTHYADLLETAAGMSMRDVPGSGAAGGTTAGLLAIAERFASFEIRPGVEVVMELTRFDEALASCDLVITGEGRIDQQTAYGKTAMGVAQRAAYAGKRCIAFGGGATPEGIEALGRLGAIVVPVIEQAMTVEEQMAAGSAPLVRAAERAARLLSLGAQMGDPVG